MFGRTTSSLVAAAALLSTILDFANASAIDLSVLKSKRTTDGPAIGVDFPDPTIFEDGANCECISSFLPSACQSYSILREFFS